MPKFRKKPVVIEAVQFLGSTSQRLAINMWMEGGEYVNPVVQTRDVGPMFIQTLEGEMTAKPGAWIIKGVNGEFYPCEDDIFRKTYDPIDTEAAEALGLEDDMKGWEQGHA